MTTRAPISRLVQAGFACSRRFLFALTFCVSVAGAAERRPNILVIMADDLGFSDLGCYGGEIATPNLDALAATGVRFTQAYNTTRCWPTRAALMTGYHAHQVRRDIVPGVSSGHRGVRPAWAKLATETLREGGYRNYHSGKWHIDGTPLDNGFDHSLEIGYGQNNYFSTQGLTDNGKPVPQTPEFYSSAALADHAVRCLREHADRYSDRPFFQFLAFTAPHFPLHAPESDIARYRERYLAGWDEVSTERAGKLARLGLATQPAAAFERDVGPPYDFAKGLGVLGPDEVNRPLPWAQLTRSQREFQATKMAIHAAMVDRMDREIGRVIAQIKAMGAWENTLVLFLSDNGASAEMMVRGEGHDPAAPPGSRKTYLCLGPGWSSAANTPFRRHKTWVHEGGISTPLIVHWPAKIGSQGGLRRTPVHVVDIMPTVIEAAGLRWTLPAGAPARPGRSFAKALTADVPIERDFLWWEHEGNRALRMGDWKLVADKNRAWELYDLGRDRAEAHNLADREPVRVREMAAAWEAAYEAYCADARRDDGGRVP